jgi:fumarate hydratase subunit beta
MGAVAEKEGRLVRLTTPLTDADVAGLRSGDAVRLSGTIYTGRDAAHRRLFDLLQRGEELPIPLAGQVIYYVGPSPAPPGRPIGSAGPTTSYRMDPFTPLLLSKGLKAVIGKGMRSPEVKEALRKYKAVYLTATGGAGALLGGSIKEAEVVAYPDLGPEAIRRLVVEDFPALVVNDIHGGDLYEEGRARYERR